MDWDQEQQGTPSFSLRQEDIEKAISLTEQAAPGKVLVGKIDPEYSSAQAEELVYKLSESPLRVDEVAEEPSQIEPLQEVPFGNVPWDTGGPQERSFPESLKLNIERQTGRPLTHAEFGLLTNPGYEPQQSFIGEFGQGVLGGLESVGHGLLTSATIPGLLSQDPLARMRAEQAYQDLQNQHLLFQLNNQPQGPGGFVGQSVGSAIPALSGLANPLLPLTTYGLSGTGAGFETARSQGEKDPIKQLEAGIGYGLAEGVMETIGFSRVAKIAPKVAEAIGEAVTRRGVKDAAKLLGRAGEIAATGALEEAATQVVQNAIDRGDIPSFLGGVIGGYDKEKDLFEGVGEAALMGAIGEMAIGSVPVAINLLNRKRTGESPFIPEDEFQKTVDLETKKDSGVPKWDDMQDEDLKSFIEWVDRKIGEQIKAQNREKLRKKKLVDEFRRKQMKARKAQHIADLRERMRLKRMRILAERELAKRLGLPKPVARFKDGTALFMNPNDAYVYAKGTARRVVAINMSDPPVYAVIEPTYLELEGDEAEAGGPEGAPSDTPMLPGPEEGADVVGPEPEPPPTTEGPSEETEKPVQPEDLPSLPDNPSGRLADAITKSILAGEQIDNRRLKKMADEAFGGTEGEGAYTPKDATDAFELAINRLIISGRYPLVGKGLGGVPVDDALHAIDQIQRIDDEIISKMPPVSRRVDEEINFQQFSTPTHLSFLANWVANIGNGDVVLEPSAGVGSLAAFAKAEGARVHVNEISERRRQLLESLGFDVVMAHDAKHIDIEDKDSQYDVVVMNPPFSATGPRGKRKDLAEGMSHIKAAFNLLRPGGRLVAIVGGGRSDAGPDGGMSTTSKKYGPYWQEILDSGGTLRADIRLPGKIYRRFGTQYPVRLVVIDKVADGGDTETVTGEISSLEEAAVALEGVHDARRKPETQEDIRPDSDEGLETSQKPDRKDNRSGDSGTDRTEDDTGEHGDDDRVGDSSGPSGDGDLDGREGSGGTRVSGGSGGSGEGRGDTEPKDGRTGGTDSDSGRQRDDTGGVEDGEETEEDGAGEDSRKAGGEESAEESGDEEKGEESKEDGKEEQEIEDKPEHENVVPEESERRSPRDGPDVGDVWVLYEPSARFKGAKKHPAILVQSKSLGAVDPPPLKVKLSIPQDIIDRGILSSMNLEAIAYAKQAHTTRLENGARAGMLIGHGTGTGKTRIIGGLILDSIIDGRKKHIWITKSKDLFDSIRETLDLLGVDIPVLTLPTSNKAKIKDEEGVLLVSYSLLSTKGSKNEEVSESPRMKQVMEWLGPDFDGVIALDEAHMAKNLGDLSNRRGASNTAIAIDHIQNSLPDARVLYATATAATDPKDYAIMNRLGLWGPGSPFPDVATFISSIEAGGISAMEILTNNLKAMGRYLAVSLSYRDPKGRPEQSVEIERLEANLDDQKKADYGVLSDTWVEIWERVVHAITDNYPAPEERLRATRMAQTVFEGTLQRFWNAVLVSYKASAVVQDAKRRLEDGKSVVIQLVGTNEAQQKRIVTEARIAGIDPEDLEFGPKAIMSWYVSQYYPVDRYDVSTDSRGNTVITRVGEDPAKVRERERLLERIADMKGLQGALDILVQGLGHENVAEITGRKSRQVIDPDTGEKIFQENRTNKTISKEIREFHEGKRLVAIISQKGDTGISLHSMNGIKNTRRRVHYLMEPGWSSVRAIQGLGRTHRTNQANAPIMVLVTTDAGGEKRFISTIAKRLAQLGALTHGERRSQGAGILTASDSLETKEAIAVYRDYWGEIISGHDPMIDPHEDIEVRMRLPIVKRDGGQAEAPPINRFLNRILMLPIEKQNYIVDVLIGRIENLVERLKKEGRYDIGLQEIKGDKIVLDNEYVLQKHEDIGQVTKLSIIKAIRYERPLSIESVEEKHKVLGYYKSKTSESIYALVDVPRKIDGSTGIATNTALIGPYGPFGKNGGRITQDELQQAYEEVGRKEAVEFFGEVQKRPPKESTREFPLVNGYVLPVWSNINAATGGGTSHVFRAVLEDRTIVGVHVPPLKVRKILRDFGIQIEMPKWTKNPREVITRVLNKDYLLVLRGGDMRIARKMIGGEYKVTLTGGIVDARSDDLKRLGVMVSHVFGSRQYVIPTGDTGVMGAVLERWPVVDIISKDERGAGGYVARSQGDVVRSRFTPYLKPTRYYPDPMAASLGGEQIRKALSEYEDVIVDGERVYVVGESKDIPEGPPRFVQDAVNGRRVPSIDEIRGQPAIDIRMAAKFLGVRVRGNPSSTINAVKIRNGLRDIIETASRSSEKSSGKRIAPAPIKGEMPKKLYEIVLDLSEAIGVKIHESARIRRRNTIGHWVPWSGQIAIRYEGDLDTIAHELSHAIDDIYGVLAPWSGSDYSPFDSELIPRFSQYGSKTPAGLDPVQQAVYARGEGFAEFMRAWLINPEEAIRRAPLTHRRFLEAVADEKVMEALKRFGHDVRVWAGSKSYEKVLANINDAIGRKKQAKRLSERLSKMGGQFNLNWVDKIYTNLIDKLYPVVKATNHVLELTGLQVLSSRDPRILPYLMAGFDEKWHEIMASGWVDDMGRPMHVREREYTSDGDLIFESTKERIGGIGWLLEPFKDSPGREAVEDMSLTQAFMVAERAIEIYKNKSAEKARDIYAKILDDALKRLIPARARIIARGLDDGQIINKYNLSDEDATQVALENLKHQIATEQAKKELEVVLTNRSMAMKDDAYEQMLDAVLAVFQSLNGIVEEAYTTEDQDRGHLVMLSVASLIGPRLRQASVKLAGIGFVAPDGGLLYTLEDEKKYREMLKEAEDALWKEYARGTTGIGAGFEHEIQLAVDTVAEIRAEDPDRHDRIKEAARRYRAFADAALRYAVSAGRLSRQQYLDIVKNQEKWVSYLRVLKGSDLDNVLERIEKLTKPKRILPKRKGSTRPIQDVYTSMLLTSAAMVMESDRNKTIRSLTDILTKARGMYEGDVLILDSVGSKAPGKDRNTVTVYRDGEPEYWYFDSNVKKALDSIGSIFSPSLVERMFHTILVKVPRSMITLSPRFAVRQIIRDSVSRAVLTRSSGTPLDTAIYIKDVDRFQQVRREAMLHGMGLFGWTRVSRSSYYRILLDEVDEIRHGRLHTILTSPARAYRGWRRVINNSEVVNRIAEYERAKEKAKKELGMSEIDASFYAAYQARDLLDFARVGSVIEGISRWILFLNPGIQGVARTAKGFKEDPKGMVKKSLLWIGMTEAIFMMIRHMLYDDEDWEEYDQLSDYRKDFFWTLKIGDDVRLAIPKPWELGLIGSFMSRAYDKVYRGKDDAFDGLAKTVGTAVIPIDDSDLLGPFVGVAEAMTNYDFFRDRPIVPIWEDALSPEMRKGMEDASVLGQWIYKTLKPALSAVKIDDPRKVDHFIRSYASWFGDFAIVASNRLDPDKPVRSHSVLGISYGPPGASAKDIRWVYDFAQKYGMMSYGAIRDLSEILTAAKRERDQKRRAWLYREAARVAKMIREAIEKYDVKETLVERSKQKRAK